MARWNVHAALAMVVMMVSGAVMVESQDCENLRLICEDEIFKRIFTDASATAIADEDAITLRGVGVCGLVLAACASSVVGPF
ncbi:hypothetical protein V6N11_042390 [Hibiscus sabdariffa]|uniref:Uncharacterized protein n=1 Tax=Hibiscus sabdariffa TaxID=183260 RepID=A0ABR2QWK8_9ROSI